MMKLRYFSTFAVFAACLLTLAGCGSGEFPVAPVSGVILCEGEPVPGGLVVFSPKLEGEGALVGKTGIGVCDEQGKFTVRTYADADGAVVGMHDVRVERGSGPGCDCAMNQDKIVAEVEVKAGEENSFTINLPPKTRGDAMAERQATMEDDEDEEDD